MVGAFRASSATWNHADKLKDFTEHGLFLNALRGVGGCGIGLLNQDWSHGVYKGPYDSPTFLQTRTAQLALKNIDTSRVILGHTRAATIGNVAADNSHPFRYEGPAGDITMIHNGTISNYRSLTPLGMNHPVDSAHIAYALAADGPEKVLSKLIGAYVLLWFNARDKTMHLAKNDDRTLYTCYVGEKFDKMYFISEMEMLAFLTYRLNIKTAGKLRKVPAMVHHIWDLSRPDLLKPEKIAYKAAAVQTWDYSKNRMGGGKPHVFADDNDMEDGWPTCGTGLYQKEAEASRRQLPGPDSGKTPVGATTPPTPRIVGVDGNPTVGERAHPLKPGSLVLVHLKDWEPYSLGIDGVIRDATPGYANCDHSVREGDAFKLHNITHKQWREQFQLLDTMQARITTGRRVNNSEKMEFGLTWTDAALDTELERQEPQMEAMVVKGPLSERRISKREFLKNSEGGCVYCGTAIRVADADEIVWINLANSNEPPIFKPICPKDVVDKAEEIKTMRTA